MISAAWDDAPVTAKTRNERMSFIFLGEETERDAEGSTIGKKAKDYQP
jgi:hypothetical protein